jgi:DNA-binding response OmpR family regulator
MNAVTLLLVEDNPADVLFFREALEATGISARVEVVEDGREAMCFLRSEGPFAKSSRPDVVVLDLNVPIRKGQEVLKDMAADSSLCTIPVAVLTTSTSETHVVKLYPPGLCLYFVKTAEFRRLQEIIRQIVAYAARV